MFAHYVAVALRNVRTAPFTSAVNVLTLAVGLVCFVTAYAAGMFWSSAEQQFRNADDVHVVTVSVKSRDNSGPGALRNATATPEVAAEALKSDFPAIAKVARAVVIDRKTMVANGANAVRLFGVAVDPEFLDIFALPFVAGDAHSALSSPRSAVLTREASARLFGADDPIGKTIVIGNAVDTTVTGVIDAIPGAVAVRPLGQRAAAVRLARVARRVRGDPAAAFRASGRCSAAARRRLVHDEHDHLPCTCRPAARCPPIRSLGSSATSRRVTCRRRCCATRTTRFGLVPVRQMLAGTRDFFDTGLSFAAVLLMLGGLVLGVACVNYANLATARAARRVREIGVRKALGASPSQIAVQSLFEAAALTLAALAVALVVFALAQPLVKDLLGANARRDLLLEARRMARRSARSSSRSRSQPARIPRSCCRACVP